MGRIVGRPLAAAALVLAGAVPAAAQYPEGAGKVIVETQCTTCHSAEVILTQKRNAKEWRQIVQSMLDRGAELTDDELPILIEYLAQHWGRDDEKAAAGSRTRPTQQWQ